ncbi:unnamed protein product [Linum tenue]|uniref:WAT1-related protein n=1 Tax=Linum tenue TaxID=586396 RepID=A0AAV0NBB7_9ROSI|nr:unnamed protein product [Linum tenue]
MRGSQHSQREVLTYSVMVGTQFSTVGINTLFKAATMEGMSPYVSVAYSYGIASLVLLLPTLFSHRAVDVPPLTIPILCRIGLLALTGSSSRLTGFTGLYYSSPTLSSAIGNLCPALTFILAVMFGMEKVVMGTRSSQAKILGTTVSIAGAFVITLYQGPPICITRSGSSSAQNWVLGGSLITLQYALVTLWAFLMSIYNFLLFIVWQTQIMRDYPSELTVIFIYNTFVSIIGAVVALIAEGTSSGAWIMSSNTALASVICTGLFGSCLNNAAEAWVLPIKGPVFANMFTPFGMVIAVAMGVALLGDTLHLGSLLGGTTISIGFYMFMWGKVKDQNDDGGAKTEQNADDNSSSSNTDKVPLL